MRAWFAAALLGAAACAPSPPGDAGPPAATGGIMRATGGTAPGTGGTAPGTGGVMGTGGAPAGTGGVAAAGTGGAPGTGGTTVPDAAPESPAPSGGPNVDRSDMKERYFTFKASDADPGANRQLGTQQALLDTRVAPRGTLVVHLHGSGEKVLCGYTDHGKVLAGFGFHVFMPCYDAAVTWNNGGCGGAVGDCRLEMLEGMDRSGDLAITRPNSVEGRLVRALAHLEKLDPSGDWGYFRDGEAPRWPRIIISGQSFGATSALLIAKHRPVVRAVALSGPLDNGAAWLKATSMTPLDRMFAFTHVNDSQHAAHKGSIGALGLAGGFVEVEKVAPPYESSHRLVGGMTMFGGARVDGHNATEARMQSPRDAASGKWVYEPVWRYLYGVDPAP